MFKSTTKTIVKLALGLTVVTALVTCVVMYDTQSAAMATAASASDVDSSEGSPVKVHLFEYDRYSKQLSSYTSRFANHIIELDRGDVYYFLDDSPEGVQLRFIEVGSSYDSVVITTGIATYATAPTEGCAIERQMPSLTTIVVKESPLP